MHRRDGPSNESSSRSIGVQRGYCTGFASSKTAGMGAAHGGSPGRATANWAPNRPSGVSSRRSYRQSNVRRTSSRAGGDIDGFAPIKLFDEQGVNRTPKPLVSIVTSAALRQARGLVTEESMVGSEASEAMLGDGLSSSGFSRCWFDSGLVTPQESDGDFQHGRLQVPNNAVVGDRGLMGFVSSGPGIRVYSTRPSHDTSSPSSSARPTGDGAPSAAAAGSAAVLTEDDLAKVKEVLLQETDTTFLFEMPGVVVAADSVEGAKVAAANQQYAAQVAARDGSDKYTTSGSQTLVLLKKQREVQTGGNSSTDAGSQACRWDIEDSYAALGRDSKDDRDEQLASVLPSGQALSTGAQHTGFQSSSQTSFLRISQQHMSRASNMSAIAGGSQMRWGSRTTGLDSSITAVWGRPSSTAGSSGKKSNNFSGHGSNSAAAAALLAATAAAPQPEPWTKLEGLAEVLAAMEAAIAQNAYLPQLLLYRNIQPTNRPSSCPANNGLGISSCSGAGRIPEAPPSPNTLRQSPSSSASRGQAADAWGGSLHTPHTPSGPGNCTAGGTGALGRASSSIPGSSSLSGASRQPSQQLPADIGASRQSSFMSLGSSRMLRSNRPPAGLQLLWTWACSLTEGLPISSIAWNRSNTNLIAAGYRNNITAAVAAAAAGSGAPGPSGAEAGSRPASQGKSRAAADAADGAAAGEAIGEPGDSKAAEAAEAAGRARGRVALWSLKNQYHPVWTFETKSAVTALDFCRQSPHILAVGLHDGTIAVYDVRSRQETPLMASTADTGKHSDPIWKVRWVDRGPEREELLVSISTDGKVKAWTIAKGLEHSTLITLKRMPHRIGSGRHPTGCSSPAASTTAAAGGEVCAPTALPVGSGARAAAAAATVAALRTDVAAERDALISRDTGGMSFDFSQVDNRVYLAGTEDGHIHKCSTSYNEQYMESYSGHIGPVYALQWSPFNPSLFISCSGDWTIRMWKEGRQQQLLTFQSSNEEVLDVQWCPHNSTVFGAVTAGGRMEIWDFAVSTLRPVVQHVLMNCSMTALMFAQDAPVVIAANDAGGLLVFRLVNVAADKLEPAELQHSRLEEALKANVMGALVTASS